MGVSCASACATDDLPAPGAPLIRTSRAMQVTLAARATHASSPQRHHVDLHAPDARSCARLFFSTQGESAWFWPPVVSVVGG
jgi:hypothetical protein